MILTDQQLIWRNATIPASSRATYDKAMGGKKVFAAVRAKCQDCMNWQNSEIKACRIEHCPLWPYRMGHKPKAGSSASQNGKEHRNASVKGQFGRKKTPDGIPVPSAASLSESAAESGAK